MKWCNSYAVVAGCTAASLIALDALAQSAFAGFYGQVSCWAGQGLTGR